MSDRIAVINKGRIEQLGDASQIYHRPKTTFVANFIGQANILRATVLSRSGDHARVRLVDGGLELLVNAEHLAGGAGSTLVSIRPEKIALRKEPQGAPENRFEARVEDELFKGATDQLRLRTDAGLVLTAVVANESSGQAALHAGDRVFCHLHPDDIVIVHEE